MGTNRRYAQQTDALMDQRVAQRVASTGELQTLTPAELGLERTQVTIDPVGVPVIAWVRFSDVPLQVTGRAMRWTSAAVGLQFEIDGRTHRCWVWSGAVQRA